ncbi:MAG: helix-turn-helix domain-containing protein [Spirochaetaceae bacterium]|jgi:cytoskeletal protein RodZ|nr:helix-turn-helix domain-containing protein [Spirochaetaceae bacterium]
MKSIGEQLKTARESKGISIDDAAREINIARKYLAALESEDFSQFTAEAYLLGFLKNYGEYLGLDVKELLSLYRIIKIQEEPVPVEQLLHTPLSVKRILATVFIVAGGLALIVGVVYYFLFMPKEQNVEQLTERQPVEYTLVEGSLEKRFYEGDALIIPVSGIDYKVSLRSIGDVITLSTPEKDIKLGLNNEASSDINNDGIMELRIAAVDYAQNRPDIGAFLRFDMLNTPSVAALEQNLGGTAAASSAGDAANAPRIIFNSASPYPFTLQMVFSSYCMFRWEILRETGRQNRNERYFVRGDEQTIQAQNGVRLWISNSSAVKIWIIGGGHNVPLELGSPGEAIVEDIYWTRDDYGRYKLIQSRLES